jgi:uncharacterized protein
MTEGKKHVLFIRGAGGDEAQAEDALLVDSLRMALGPDYEVCYPDMPDDEAPDSDWMDLIANELAKMPGTVILVGHSFGGLILLKHLAAAKVREHIAGLFLIAVPFWGEGGWQFEGFTMPKNYTAHIPKGTPVFLYQNHDDEIVPFSHLALFTAKLPQATVHEGTTGGHQFSNDLGQVAKDIKQL